MGGQGVVHWKHHPLQLQLRLVPPRTQLQSQTPGAHRQPQRSPRRRQLLHRNPQRRHRSLGRPLQVQTQRLSLGSLQPARPEAALEMPEGGRGRKLDLRSDCLPIAGPRRQPLRHFVHQLQVLHLGTLLLRRLQRQVAANHQRHPDPSRHSLKPRVSVRGRVDLHLQAELQRRKRRRNGRARGHRQQRFHRLRRLE